MKIALLSNINIDSLAMRIQKVGHKVYSPSGYGAWAQELVGEDSGLFAFAPEAVFILLDGEELLRGKPYDLQSVVDNELDLNLQYISTAVNDHPGIHFYVSNFDIPHRKINSLKEIRSERVVEAFWYERLADLNQKHDRFFIFDLKRIAEELGRNEFYSPKLWYMGGMKFSFETEKRIKTDICRYVDAQAGKKMKCLALDLDNTLWGGIIGESDVNGIDLSEFKEGARFKDFQKRIKEIKELGAILAIVSKNNPDDALEVISKHPQMVLREDDFVSMKINWESKAQNVRALADELNIGLDSILFIDDSEFEREDVRTHLPQVCVPEFPRDTTGLERFAVDLYYNYFLTLKTTDEDKNKTEMYRNNTARASAIKSTLSIEDLLTSFQTIIEIDKARERDVPRAAQLTQKTNQFNLTSKRYTENEIRTFIHKKDYFVYIAGVKDKYGDNGKVSLLIARKCSGDCAELDLFLLSCRVIGRFVEDQLINFLEHELIKKGISKLIAYYRPTKKNMLVSQLFDRLGYETVEEDGYGNKKYVLDLRNRDNKKIKLFGELKTATGL